MLDVLLWPLVFVVVVSTCMLVEQLFTMRRQNRLLTEERDHLLKRVDQLFVDKERLETTCNSYLHLAGQLEEGKNRLLDRYKEVLDLMDRQLREEYTLLAKDAVEAAKTADEDLGQRKIVPDESTGEQLDAAARLRAQDDYFGKPIKSFRDAAGLDEPQTLADLHKMAESLGHTHKPRR